MPTTMRFFLACSLWILFLVLASRNGCEASSTRGLASSTVDLDHDVVESDDEDVDRELIIPRWREWLDLIQELASRTRVPTGQPTAQPMDMPTSLDTPNPTPLETPNPTPLPTLSDTPDPTLLPTDMTTTPAALHCTCHSCTEEVWNTPAGADGATCGSRIDWLEATFAAFDELGACRRIGFLEYADACGACDPDRCDGRIPPPLPTSYCGCDGCTHDVWMTPANNGGPTCGARITWQYLTSPDFPTEESACRLVGTQEVECTACHPDTCMPLAISPAPSPAPSVSSHPTVLASHFPSTSPSASSAPSAQATTVMPTSSAAPTGESQRCGCSGCSDAIWNLMAGDYTCGERITYLQSIGLPEFEACRQVAGEEYPFLCGPGCDPDYCDGQCPPEPSPEGYRCGCEECTDAIWNAAAGEYTCGARMEWVADQGACPASACRFVSRYQYPAICGPACDPDLCGGRTLPPSPLTLGPAIPLYCFAPYEERMRWEDAWGDFYLEAKQGYCGPGNNAFTNNTIQFENDELTMDFKRVNGIWEASEVRVVMPYEKMPYRYGTYRFSVKSVSVIDSVTDAIVSNALPPTLVLGLFTWDDTESYAAHENWNHEVDIELSRWGNPEDHDAQFLVQPPAYPQYYRFSSGPDGTLDQGGHSYEFTWNPAEITWYTDARGGVSHSYTTEQAQSLGLEDFVQCLPADMEVRINLWNMHGAVAPDEMQDTHIARVVIDDFTYTPSGLEHVPVGGYCSKRCQCGSDALCQDGLCTLI